MKTARAIARANIALAKYWGKSDRVLNLPAVPSISITLDGFETDTRVTFDPRFHRDTLVLNGRRATGDKARRAIELLDRVRALAGLAEAARVESRNSFPTSSGLASSSSGFAALAAAASRAAGLRCTDSKLSALARQSSASAARSIFGGFVELKKGRKGEHALAARPVASPDHWNIRLVVAVTTDKEKEVGSTEGMERSRKTSPYYERWLEEAPTWAATVRRGIRSRNLSLVGEAMERSTLAFHACAMTSSPPIVYWRPATLGALRAVWTLRDGGTAAYATMDAGPHVKVLCHARDARRVSQALRRTDGVRAVVVAKAGRGVEVYR